MQKSQLLRLLTIAEAPNIARTKTSKKSDKLIDEFQNRLAGFIWLSQQRRITEDDKKRLFVIFYKYAEAQYFLGQEYADKASGETKPVSKGDLDRIDRLAKQSLRDFWSSLRKQGITKDYDNSITFHDIDKLLQTHNDFDEVIQQAWKNKKEETIPDFITRIGAFITRIGAIVGNITGIFASDMGIRALNQGTVSNAQIVTFVSRKDTRVCPICEAYDGSTYRVDSSTGIVIGGPTIPVHPRCRCRYLLPEGETEL